MCATILSQQELFAFLFLIDVPYYHYSALFQALTGEPDPAYILQDLHSIFNKQAMALLSSLPRTMLLQVMLLSIYFDRYCHLKVCYLSKLLPSPISSHRHPTPVGRTPPSGAPSAAIALASHPRITEMTECHRLCEEESPALCLSESVQFDIENLECNLLYYIGENKATAGKTFSSPCYSEDGWFYTERI